ncbi:hypothetical protein [Peribacillus frigoritolerans]|uniref:hypothetical protein n=1 Tax=Peribacillus frigoritolerans TaxID=450367 RepID=UPI0007BFB321|nr:hypothetical protein [Peribacillus frigoritolerans]MCM3169470.1 hypothetical protein [Peribacillus frigoritolerans]
MEIKIRNVDPVALKKIDEMAKRKSISRQEFLKSAVEKIAYEKDITEKEARLEMIISKNIEAMEQMNYSVTRLENLMADLLEE